MKNNFISNIRDVRELLRKNNVKLFGIGGFPSIRSEIWPLVPDYEVLCANRSGELESVRKNVRVKVFQIRSRSVPYLVKKPATLLADERVVSHIKSRSMGKRVGIYIYQPSAEAEIICRKNNWVVIGNPIKLYKKLDSRSVFHKILREIGYRKKVFSTNLKRLPNELDNIFKNFGDRVVIQLLDEGGGRGTLFFEKKDKGKIISRIKKRLHLINKGEQSPDLIVSRFIDGPAISITGCITRENGILSSFCQFQLVDIPEVTRHKEDATGIFCGHDWSMSNKIPANIHRKAQKLVEKIGLALKKRGALGIFGLDLMWNQKTNALFPLEINLRLLGTFPTAVYVQLEKNEVPLVAFHILDFLKIPYRISSLSVFRKNSRRRGAHLLFFNPFGKDARCGKSLAGGVYNLKNDRRLAFVHFGVELKDIKGKGDFVLTEGVPSANTIYRKNGKLLKAITGQPISKNGGRELNIFGKSIARAVYRDLKLTPYEKS